MNYWPLLGIALVVIGFALRFNPLLVVVGAALATGLLAGLDFVAVVEALGKAFNDNRYISVTWIILPVIGLLERYGLQQRARAVIESLRGVYGTRRVAYIDIDAHHGDGVFYAFEADPEVCIADIHEDGRYLYPGTGFAHETGKGAAAGTKLNLPAPPGADDRFFDHAWPQALEFVRAARPEFIILQAGWPTNTPTAG